MTGWTYLAALVLATGCMLLLDWRYRLFLWRRPRTALAVTGIAVAGLLAADAAGIALGLFIRGDSVFATGVVIAPHVPLEEPFFLLFLILATAVLYTGSARLLERRARA